MPEHKRSGSTSPDPGRIEVEIRPKTLQKRLAPVRQVGRENTSRVVGMVIHRHEAFVRIAQHLWVGESIVRRWADPSEPQQLDLADVVALYHAGSKTLAIGLLDEVRSMLLALDEGRGWPVLEHSAAISAEAGQCAAAAHAGDLEQWRAALTELSRGVHEAQVDAAKIAAGRGRR